MMWRKIALGIALLAAVAAPAALHAVTAPVRETQISPAKQAAKAFVPVCKAAEVVDTRPDPAWVRASFANDHCQAPDLPAPIDGYSASREAVVAGMTVTKNYMAKADAYQRCVGDFIALEKSQAQKHNRPIDAMLVLIENHRIAASQANEKKADTLIKIAINAFNELGSECPD
jgi:hypothetical protein